MIVKEMQLTVLKPCIQGAKEVVSHPVNLPEWRSAWSLLWPGLKLKQPRHEQLIHREKLNLKRSKHVFKLDALNNEKEKDAAIAEANTLTAGKQEMGFEVCNESHNSVPQSIKDQRVAAYVSEQASLCSNFMLKERAIMLRHHISLLILSKPMFSKQHTIH